MDDQIFGGRKNCPTTPLNFTKCTFLSHSWQPIIKFHSFLGEERERNDDFWLVIAEIDVALFLTGARA